MNNNVEDLQMSHWHKWTERNELRDLGFSGIYILAYSETDIFNGKFEFKEEIVYIGQTSAQTLKARLQQFDDTIKEIKLRHGGADRMLYIHRDYKKLTSNLYFSFFKLEYDPKIISSQNYLLRGEILKLEYICFSKYFNFFEKLPIFNLITSPKFSKN
jgi:hypothetical protein